MTTLALEIYPVNLFEPSFPAPTPNPPVFPTVVAVDVVVASVVVDVASVVVVVVVALVVVVGTSVVVAGASVVTD